VKTSKIMVIVLTVLLAITMLAGCSSTPAEKPPADQPVETTFPEKSIDLTILFGAGGAADVIGRKLADGAAEKLGKPIVANVRTGGGGAVGYQYVLGQDPDGYNIVWNSTSICVTYHQGNMPADQDFSAFRGVAKISEEASAIAVKADAPWKNLEEFVAYAKANPGKVTVANSGVGSFNHLTAAAIEDALGVQFKHIPLDSKESVTALLGGRVDAMVNMAFDAIPQVEAGEMRALAIVGTQRIDAMPDVPTMKEQGYDVDLLMWRGIAVPKDTPDEVVLKLQDAFLESANSDEFKEFAKKYSLTVAPTTGAEFDAYMAEQDKMIADLMEKIGLKKQ